MKRQMHQIQKQHLLFDFSNEEKASNWNRSASNFFYNDVLPMLTVIFDKHYPESHHFYIEKLEIDLGIIEEENLKEAFLRKAEVELNRILKSKLNLTINSANDTYENNSEANETATKKILIKDKKEHLLECFYYFLVHGILPWNSSYQSLMGLETSLIQDIGMEKLTGNPSFQKLLQHKAVRRRLYFQFSPDFWEEINNRWIASAQASTYPLHKELKRLLLHFAKNKSSKSQIKKLFSKGIYDWIAEVAPMERMENVDLLQQYFIWMIEKASFYLKPNKENMLTGIISLVNKHMIKINTDEIQKIFKESDALSDVNEQKNKTLPDEIPDLDGFHNKSTEISENSRHELSPGSDLTGKEKMDDTKNPIQKKSEIIVDNSTKANVAEAVRAENMEDLRISDFPLNSAYYSQHAGLVLTWPYLGLLFKKLDYFNGKDFKEEQYKQRAVHLLAYIASGQEHSEEHELILEKFLCGWPLHKPIIKSLQLFEREKKEANLMLQNLVDNWQVLKNTSIEGLRSSFFIRDGKLATEEDHWKLQVEQKSFDMLLGHLPYTISIIKLPWIEKILEIDWA